MADIRYSRYVLNKMNKKLKKKKQIGRSRQRVVCVKIIIKNEIRRDRLSTAYI